ncbi:MAG: YigZ family protein, partial [Bacteroidota bacterium]|nr:YigZ family protein [Candidatus Kapabacteria bacterium]MDW8221085.1 YigZ family protein [Bacteroidota bacterium]
MTMSTELDTYWTIASRERAEIVIKGSRFISSLAPVRTKEDALRYIDHIRKEFYDASHNCFAYRLGSQGLNFRFGDDGEPSGSAGKPILFTLQQFGVSDIVAVVTRYFGGTKLGVGGLARAYTNATKAALQLCTKIPVVQTKLLRVCCVYEDITTIRRLLAQYAMRHEETY